MQLVGVVGLGGLGLAVKFARALGARVAVFTTSPDKAGPARDLGADEVVVSGDAAAMAAQADRFDFILDTASAKHDPSPYLRALRMDGTLCMLGIPALRRTGMPVAKVRDFVTLGPGTAEHAGQRLLILQEQEAQLLRRREELEEDLRIRRDKISTYRDMMAHGRDCEDED